MSRRRTLQVGHRTLSVTEGFDAYWHFARERQLMYYRRLRGDGVWTTDTILQQHRFTNAYRAADRVSQYLLTSVIPNSRGARDTVFRILLFKIFNRIETWELLEQRLSSLHVDSFTPERYGSVLTAISSAGTPIYSAAYIMPSPPLGEVRKHANHLLLLRQVTTAPLIDRILDSASLRALYEALLAVPSFGSFLAFQYAIDLNYSDLFRFDEMEFVVAGPGALDGIAKCFSDTAGLSAADVIRLVAELAPSRLHEDGLPGVDLYGRQLQLIDCQNLFCETGKYCRLALPALSGPSGRTRIKQRFARSPKALPMPSFPQAWGLDAGTAPNVPKATLAIS